MTTYFQFNDNVGSGDRITLAPGDDLVIGSGAHVASHNAAGVYAVGSAHIITVQGTVAGDTHGVRVGDSLDDFGNIVQIAQGSLVSAANLGYGVNLFGSNNLLLNEGMISGGYIGVYMGMIGTGSIINKGSIAGGFGIIIGSAADNISETAKVVNYGTIIGTGTGTGNAILGSWDADRIVNRGVVHGEIYLGADNDLYDGRGGVIEGGAVLGGAGNDVFFPGAGAEELDGSWDLDTLDFRGSSGLRVSLMDDSGTGLAEGDIYLGFERVLGSRSGADTLIGDAVNNTLEGFGGADTLRGGLGEDQLVGGAEKDRLSGGLGDDSFLFNSPGHGGDLISDWGAGSSNNDHFLIKASAFGGGLLGNAANPGALAATRFVNRLSDHLAQDADDRFIYRKDNTTFWFDVDGKGGAAAVLLADLQAGAAVGVGDVLLC